jgi:hypothetical protein
VVERRPQRGELVVATDERQRDRRRSLGLPVVVDEPRCDGLGLALQHERRLERAEHEARADRTGSAVGDDDRSRLRSLLEARRHVHDVSRDVEVAPAFA